MTSHLRAHHPEIELERAREEIAALKSEVTTLRTLLSEQVPAVVRIRYRGDNGVSVTRLSRVNPKTAEVLVLHSHIGTDGWVTVLPERTATADEALLVVAEAFATEDRAVEVHLEAPFAVTLIGAVPDWLGSVLKRFSESLVRPATKAEAMMAVAGSSPPW